MASVTPSAPTEQGWRQGRAIALTLVLAALPYAVVVVGTALLGRAALIGLGPAGVLTVTTWAATQRLVKFMLTGEIQEMDRTRRPTPGRPAGPARVRRHRRRPRP